MRTSFPKSPPSTEQEAIILMVVVGSSRASSGNQGVLSWRGSQYYASCASGQKILSGGLGPFPDSGLLLHLLMHGHSCYKREGNRKHQPLTSTHISRVLAASWGAGGLSGVPRSPGSSCCDNSGCCRHGIGGEIPKGKDWHCRGWSRHATDFDDWYITCTGPSNLVKKYFAELPVQNKECTRYITMLKVI